MDIKKTKKYKLEFFILILISFLSYWRSPYIFTHGRFMSEEGSKHFAYAYENGFWEGLFYVEKMAGYYNFIANFLAGLSTLIVIEFSPLITAYGSLIFILLLIYFVLFRDSELFDNKKKKIIGSFLLFITPPFVAEIWANSINSQIYLCLSAVVILFMVNLSNFQKKINHFIILIASFSGIYTCCLLPLYAMNFIFKKNFYNLLNFLILFTASCFQLFLIYQSKTNNLLPASVLAADLDINTVINYIYNVLIKSFFGRHFVHFFWENLNSIIISLNYIYVLFSFIFLILIILLFNYKKITNLLIKDKVLLYLILIFLIISALVLIGSVGYYIGGRYAAVPGAILLLITLHVLFKTQLIKIKIIFSFLIFFSLASGSYEFRPPKGNLKHNYIKMLDCLNCPVWKNEIRKWKQDNQYIIKIWPYPRKNMKLKKPLD